MQFPKLSSLFSLSPQTPPSEKSSSIVGASAAEPVESHYLNHEHLLKWIHETKHKIPVASHKLREEAFEADPLISGTIFPYLQNTILKGFTIQTKDNKLYSQAIEEITDWLESISIMGVFREDFIDYKFLVGHTYRRMDKDMDGNVCHLEKIEPSTVTKHIDPWDSTFFSYHQHAKIDSSWSSYGVSETFDSWFIPYSNSIKDIYETYVEGRNEGNNEAVKARFEELKLKYKISDISNLQVSASERILAMDNASVRRKKKRGYDYDNDQPITDRAPIDPVILAIWLKRLLLTNSPNLIYAVLSPFIHVKNGHIQVGKDMSGNPVFITSTPRKPAEGSFNYAAEIANYNAYIASMQTLSDNVTKSQTAGGSLTTGPEVSLEPVESAKSVSDNFIKMLIDQLNEEIGQNSGFPMALFTATGTELASSRIIAQNFNNVHAGERTEYESIADKLIKINFGEKTWTTKDENGKEITYKFADTKAHFTLDTPDTKDLLTEAQVAKTYAETLAIVKNVGASQMDSQALGEEYGFGLLGLDNYEAQINPLGPKQVQEVNTILKACLFGAMQEGGLLSAKPTDPSNFDETKLVKKLQEAYEEGMETIFEE